MTQKHYVDKKRQKTKKIIKDERSKRIKQS